MTKLFATIYLSIALTNIHAQSFSWAKKGGLWAYDYGFGITHDNSGNVYVAGKYEMNANFSGTVLPIQGNHDIFLAQYSPSGNLNWIRTAGGYSGDYATCVATDSKFVYIGGEVEGYNATIKFPGSSITLKCKNSNDIMLAKYTLSGTLLWARSAGGNDYEKALGITYDAAGNIYICGLFRSSVTFGASTVVTSAGENDIFIAKYDANGNFQWVRKAGSSKRDEAKSIKCDAAGNLYICGMYRNGCQFGSQYLSAPNGYSNAFIAKYSSSGNLLWVKSGGGNYDDAFWSLALDNTGKVYVGGEFNANANFGGISIYTSGSADILVGCYDGNGNALWMRKAGGKGLDRARGLACVGSKLYITGQFGSTANFGSTTKTAADASDVFIASLDTQGNFLWASAVGGGVDAPESLGYESGCAITAELNGNVYATGSTISGGTFGSTSLSAYSRTDVFVTKITSPPAAQDPDDSPQVRTNDKKQNSAFATGEDPAEVEKNFKIYPNPSSGQFTLDLNFKEAQGLEMSVYTTSGQLVTQKTVTSPSRTDLDLTGNVKGIYLVVIRSGVTAHRKKVVLQ